MVDSSIFILSTAPFVLVNSSTLTTLILIPFDTLPRQSRAEIESALRRSHRRPRARTANRNGVWTAFKRCSPWLANRAWPKNDEPWLKIRHGLGAKVKLRARRGVHRYDTAKALILQKQERFHGWLWKSVKEAAALPIGLPGAFLLVLPTAVELTSRRQQRPLTRLPGALWWC